MNTVEWANGTVRLIDQTLLPLEQVWVECSTYQEVGEAIRSMKVRGAPAIGVTAAYGMALGALQYPGSDPVEFVSHMRQVADFLSRTRPTAVNLFWALEKCLAVATEAAEGGVQAARDRLLETGHRILEEDIEANRKMGALGAALLPDVATVLTHCNAGALATAGYGTALGVIRAAVEAGKRIDVYANETRPLLQGARLTAWELVADGIPVTLITDNMAGYFMRQGVISAVVVGADRIAANGDVANKIGTYSVAVLAKENGIPFYVAAPTSTLDLSIPSGDEIVIEERDPREVLYLAGKRIAPEGVAVRNPAFDVTPHRYITAIITERGVARHPFHEALWVMGKDTVRRPIKPRAPRTEGRCD
ncbi:MAG TPA: S-methyl-5-thioribose-1-phosphate isomerase [Chloroflexota bacterium]|nr:S-methyl-5-thioribose-1-phosphate isomerase [Chloroflexota bacterium]